MMTETLGESADVLCTNWDEIGPLIAAVQRRTGLSRTEALLLYVASLTGDEDEGTEPWATE